MTTMDSRLSRSMPMLLPKTTTTTAATAFFLPFQTASPPALFRRRPLSVPRRRTYYWGGVPTTLIGADSYPNRGRAPRRLIMVGNGGRCYSKVTRSSSSDQLSRTTVFSSMEDLRDTGRKQRATSCEDVLRHVQRGASCYDVYRHVQTSTSSDDVHRHVQTATSCDDVYSHVQTAVDDSPGQSESGVSLNDSRLTDLGSFAGLEDGDGVSQCSFGSSSAFHETTCDSELDRPDSDCLSVPGSLFSHVRGDVVSHNGDSYSSRFGEGSRGGGSRKSRHDSGGRDKSLSELTTSSGRSSPSEYRAEFFHSTPTKRGSPVLSIFPGDEEDLHFPSNIRPDPLLFSPASNTTSKNSHTAISNESHPRSSSPGPSEAVGIIAIRDTQQTDREHISGSHEHDRIITQDPDHSGNDNTADIHEAVKKTHSGLLSSGLEQERSYGESVQSWLTTGHPEHHEIVTDPTMDEHNSTCEEQRPCTDHHQQLSIGSVRDRVKAIEQLGSQHENSVSRAGQESDHLSAYSGEVIPTARAGHARTGSGPESHSLLDDLHVSTEKHSLAHECDELYSGRANTVNLLSSHAFCDTENKDTELGREVNSKVMIEHQGPSASSTFFDSLRRQLSLVAAESSDDDDLNPDPLHASSESSLYEAQLGDVSHDHLDGSESLLHTQTGFHVFPISQGDDEAPPYRVNEKEGVDSSGLAEGRSDTFVSLNKQRRAEGNVICSSNSLQGNNSLETERQSLSLPHRGRERPEENLYHAKVIHIWPPGAGGELSGHEDYGKTADDHSDPASYTFDSFVGPQEGFSAASLDGCDRFTSTDFGEVRQLLFGDPETLSTDVHAEDARILHSSVLGNCPPLMATITENTNNSTRQNPTAVTIKETYGTTIQGVNPTPMTNDMTMTTDTHSNTIQRQDPTVTLTSDRHSSTIQRESHTIVTFEDTNTSIFRGEKSTSTSPSKTAGICIDDAQARSSDTLHPSFTQTTNTNKVQSHRHPERSLPPQEPTTTDLASIQFSFSSLLNMPLSDEEPSMHHNVDMILHDCPPGQLQPVMMRDTVPELFAETGVDSVGNAIGIVSQGSRLSGSSLSVPAEPNDLSESNVGNGSRAMQGSVPVSDDKLHVVFPTHQTSLNEDVAGCYFTFSDSPSYPDADLGAMFHSKIGVPIEGKPVFNPKAEEPRSPGGSAQQQQNRHHHPYSASSLRGRPLRAPKTRNKSVWVQEKLLLFQRLLNDFETQSKTLEQSLVDEMVDVKPTSGQTDSEVRAARTEACDDLYRSFTREYLETRQNHVCLFIEDHMPVFRFKRYVRKKHNSKMKGRKTLRIRHRLEQLLESVSAMEGNAALMSKGPDSSSKKKDTLTPQTTTTSTTSSTTIRPPRSVGPVSIIPTKGRVVSDVFTDVTDDETSFRDSAYSSMSASTSRLLSSLESTFTSQAGVSTDNEKLMSVSSDVFDQLEVFEGEEDEGLLDRLRVCHFKAHKP